MEIENLKEDVLVCILSKLTLPEATRTSVLGHRWKNLWKLVSRLNFNARENTLFPLEWIDDNVAWYVDWVSRVLRSHSASLVELSIHCGLESAHIDAIKEWLEIAAQKRVCVLYFNPSRYNFDHQQPCRLSLEQCADALLGLQNISSLTTLNLTTVKLTQQLIESILSRCLHLETLYLGLAESVPGLTIETAESSKLRRLDINGEDDIRELCASNLEEFIYVGNVFRPTKVEVPKVDYIMIIVEEPPPISSVITLATLIPQLQFLSLAIEHVYHIDLKQFPSQEKAISITPYSYNAESCMTYALLLNACPSLQELEIVFPLGAPQLGDEDKLVMPREVNLHPLECLRKLEFIFSDGGVLDWKLIEVFIGISPNLKMLISHNQHQLLEGAIS